MICNDGLRDTKPSKDVVENKLSSCFRIVEIGWHGFGPLCEIVESHNNVMMARY